MGTRGSGLRGSRPIVKIPIKALAKAHASLIQDYKCVEWLSQDPVAVIRAPVAHAADQVPQATTPLLIPPLNQ